MTDDSANQQNAPELSVLGDSIERLYRNFLDKKYIVNRRYQRKLVWTIEEKMYFIDSISRQFPIPLILLAERSAGGTSLWEIIDGLQRLNAIFSFIENEFSLDNGHFDLNSTAVTKELFDSGKLEQKTPVISRAMSVNIAAYRVPLSIFEALSEEPVEEVFRRINSGGRQLSRQDLRAAGALGRFADLVRKLSTLVRGDVTAGNVVPLNEIKKVSLTSRSLDYGIATDTLFWVSNGILNKDQVRESRDEELIADILAYMILTDPPPSRSEHMDDYFGLGRGEASSTRHNEIEAAVARQSEEVITDQFVLVLDEIKLAIGEAEESLSSLIFGKALERAPRYFQVIFLAMFDQLIRQHKIVANRKRWLKSYIKSAIA